MTSSTPDADMMALVKELARFMITLDEKHLAGVFADRHVTIIENFAPHIFSGPSAAADWAEGFCGHASGLSDLSCEFGDANDFSLTGGLAFFTLPTMWAGKTNGEAFREEGGWAFILVRQDGEWRIRGYGWAVTDMTFD